MRPLKPCLPVNSRPFKRSLAAPCVGHCQCQMAREVFVWGAGKGGRSRGSECEARHAPSLQVSAFDALSSANECSERAVHQMARAMQYSRVFVHDGDGCRTSQLTAHTN